jgi:uncharacterized membrane protein
MGLNLTSQPVAWIIILVLLVACWPISQSLRHEKLHPVAAYLLFTSVLALVAALVFFVLIRIASAVFEPSALEGAGPAIAITLLSLVPGFVAARWIVGRPQWRRMPK